MDQKNWLGE